jgi:predicted short-subunit dehydrogenase-like oxidoreductase (DUF2520 family)
MHKPQQSIPVSIIGAGKVGTTLAVLLKKAGYRIVSVMSRKKSSARKLARLVGCTSFSDSLANLHFSTRILLLACPEETISAIVGEIKRNASIDFTRCIVFHTSGSLTCDVLAPLRKKGATVFSLHPIQTFPKALPLSAQMEQMKDIWYGFEGERDALQFACRLVKDLGGRIVRIPKEEKILYHIVCVLASNYSVAILGAVETLARRVGNDLTLRQVIPLIRTSIEHAFQLTPEKALTGPIARGSVSTVQKHLQKLEKVDKRLAILYRQLGKQALEMVKKRNSLAPKLINQIQRIL